jgi:hypothetical protein
VIQCVAAANKEVGIAPHGHDRHNVLTYSAKKNGTRFVNRVGKGNVMEVSLPAFSAFSAFPPFGIIFRLQVVRFDRHFPFF